MSKYVPHATRARLPEYYQVLKALQVDKVEYIMSSKLNELLKIHATTIRKDFSYVGKMGVRGLGYHIDSLIDIFESEFNLNTTEVITIFGAGHLGQAVINYYLKMDSFAKIEQIYDVSKDLIGKVFNDIEVLDYKDVNKKKLKNSRIAILAVPKEEARDVFENLIAIGFKGFINFTGVKIYSSYEDVIIKELDINQTIQKVIYDLCIND